MIFGPLTFILFCAGLQFVGTVATALSTSFFGFIACRVLAGIGAGAMMPSLVCRLGHAPSLDWTFKT